MTDCNFPEYDRRGSCRHADDAAEKAVKKTFAILGVNIDEPKEVAEFQQSLRFSDKLRKTADKGVVAFVVTLMGLMGTALWLGLKIKFGGGEG